MENLFEGTWIQEVIEIARKGKFSEIEEDIKPSEKVIGEMTLLEKALYTWLENSRKKAKKIKEKILKETNEKTLHELSDFRVTFENVQEYMRITLLQRFSCHRIALRKGFKVVDASFPLFDSEFIASLLKELPFIILGVEKEDVN